MNMTEMVKIKNKKTKKKSKFWLGFAVYAGLLVILIGVFSLYVNSTMKDYEASQPELIIDDLVAELESGKTTSIEGASASKFEAENAVMEQFTELVSGSELTYSRASLTSDKAVYSVKKDSTEVAKVTVKASNTRNVLAILSISDWSLESIEMTGVKGNNSIKITAPDSYKVCVNDVELGEAEKLENTEQAEGLQYAAEYVDVPVLVTYEVSGLINEPVVTVFDGNNEAVAVPAAVNSKISIGFESEEIPDNIREYVTTAAMDYSNFFSRDIAGCSESTECIQKYFPKDSYYIVLAEQYRQEDMWMYSAHDTPVFRNITISDYTVYTDKLFSVTVYFEKDMLLTATGKTSTDINNQTYYYVNIDGSWLIADIQNNG